MPPQPKFSKPYPYDRDIASQNTRCELAEGVAFDATLAPADDRIRMAVSNMIHEYLEWIFGPATKE